MLEHEAFWRRFDEVEARLTAGLSERMLDLAELRPGARVLDLATGRGEPALRAARRVGPTGEVVGVDPSPRLLAMAREAAVRDGLENLTLHTGDAETIEVPPASFDAVTCRWGFMYMADPIAALAQAGRALAPGAPLVAALWCAPERVAYHTLPRRLWARHGPVPALDPERPGPFRFAELARTERDFERAGLVIDLVEERDVDVFASEDPAELVAWVRGLGLSQLMQDHPLAAQQAWERELVDAVRAVRPDGALRLGGTTRLVRARRIEP